MMKSMRSKTSGIIAKVLLGVVTIAFVVGGFAGFISGAPSSTVVSAGGTDIEIRNYRLAFQQAEFALAQRLQRRPTREEALQSGIEQQVMAQLVTEAVLTEQARQLGLGLSEDRVAQILAQDPTFQDASGNFSRGQFGRFLNDIGMNENDFILNREGAAIRSQIVDAVAGGADAPALVRTAFGLYSGERRTVDYVTLPVSLVEPVAEPSAEALQAYFDKNKGRYAAPDYRAVSYVLMTPEALANPAAITDEEVRKDYDDNQQRFTVPERRQIQQLVYPDAAKAEAARAQLGSGKTFDDLIQESGRTAADADLGLLAKADIPDPALADAAFALKPGEVSNVVQGTFGPVLLRVTEIQPQSVRPFDEVREEIRKELALAAGAQAVQQAYDAYEDARAGGATMDEAAQRAGVTVSRIADVSRAGLGPDDKPVAGLPDDPRFLDGVFSADVGTENPPLSVQPSGFLFYEVTKVDPARDRTLDEVRARVVADWKADEAQRLLAERADALKARVEKGETLDAVAAAESLQKGTAPSITRTSGVASIGQDGVTAAFGGPDGLVATARGADGTSRLVLKVVSVAPPADPAGAIGANDATRLDQLFRQDLLQSYVDGLREDYRVVSYPAAIERAKAELR